MACWMQQCCMPHHWSGRVSGTEGHLRGRQGQSHHFQHRAARDRSQQPHRASLDQGNAIPTDAHRARCCRHSTCLRFFTPGQRPMTRHTNWCVPFYARNCLRVSLCMPKTAIGSRFCGLMRPIRIELPGGACVSAEHRTRMIPLMTLVCAHTSRAALSAHIPYSETPRWPHRPRSCRGILRTTSWEPQGLG